MTDSDLIVDFLNTLDVQDATDVLDSDRTWLAWLEEHGMATPRVQLRRHRTRARTVRDELRLLARGERTGVREFPLTLMLGAGQPGLGGDDPLQEILGAVARLAVLGELARVKTCPADDCRWAFHDTSRNGSRQWCSMAVCGNRAKARSHRARHGAGSSA